MRACDRQGCDDLLAAEHQERSGIRRDLCEVGARCLRMRERD